MSSFICEICGALCADSPGGYTGCEHYPEDPESPVDLMQQLAERAAERWLGWKSQSRWVQGLVHFIVSELRAGGWRPRETREG